MRGPQQHKEEEVREPKIDADCVFLVYWMSYDLDGQCIDGFDRDDCCFIGPLDSISVPNFSNSPGKDGADRLPDGNHILNFKAEK